MTKDQYAVIGNPIKHSLSPRIHTLFAEQTNEDISYVAKAVPPQSLESALDKLQDEGVKGLSVTLPLKVSAYTHMDHHSDRARIAECINTIKFEDSGDRFGDNTDGDGLLQDLKKNVGLELAQKNILLLGAGGAVRNCIWPLLNEKVNAITIANRTLANAKTLCEYFDDDLLQACALSEIPDAPFDIIINGTSASLQGEMPPITSAHFDKNTVYYDLMYGDNAEKVLEHMRSLGIQHVHDGLGMLVEQAALQFQLWRGVLPETQAVIETLHKAKR